MPLYEYICQEDGERIELLRPMADADAPVEDPKGRGRTFKRAFSRFQVKNEKKKSSAPSFPSGGGCACGNPHGPCGN